MRASILDRVALACTLIDGKPLGEMAVFVEMLLNLVAWPGVFVDWLKYLTGLLLYQFLC